MEVKIEDYLSDDQIREILQDELRIQVSKHFDNETNAQRLISNLAYQMVYDEVDKILPNYHEKLVQKVVEMIDKPSTFNLFDYHYTDGSPKSVGAKIIVDAVNQNKELIKNKVVETIQNRDYSDEVFNRFEKLGENFASNIYDLVELMRSKNG